jgi:hypothetical protein
VLFLTFLKNMDRMLEYVNSFHINLVSFIYFVSVCVRVCVHAHVGMYVVMREVLV